MKSAICGAGLCVLILAGSCLADAGGGSPPRISVAQPSGEPVGSSPETTTDGVPVTTRGTAAPRTEVARRLIQAASSEAVFTYDALGRLVEIVRPSGK